MKNLIVVLAFFIHCVFTFTSCETISPSLDDDKIKGCTDQSSFNYNPDAEENDHSCSSMKGCLGYKPNLYNSGTQLSSLGDPFYDQKMSEEFHIQSQFFNGIPAELFIIEEPSFDQRNAWASSNGSINFGYYFFYSILGEFGELPIAGVLAHEYAHRVQFHLGFTYSKDFHQELESDAFSGFYMAMAKQWSWQNIESYFAHVYSTGDTDFNHKDHHGTNLERLNSAYLGVLVAIDAMNNNKQYSYQELHQIFTYEIENFIAPRSLEMPEFKEVKYPKLSQTEIESLYPYNAQ